MGATRRNRYYFLSFLWPWFWGCIIRCWWFGRRAKGGQQGRRQDADVNCDDSWSFLPLTSSTLLRGGESVATERNLKDGEGFHHRHKHGLVRGMRVHQRALWTVHFIHTYVGTLARASFLLVFHSLRSPPSFTHTLMQGKTRGREKASDSFISPLSALLYMLWSYVLQRM